MDHLIHRAAVIAAGLSGEQPSEPVTLLFRCNAQAGMSRRSDPVQLTRTLVGERGPIKYELSRSAMKVNYGSESLPRGFSS